MSDTPLEIVPDKVSGTLSVGTNGKGEVILGFNVHEMILDATGSGHVVFSPRQARQFVMTFAKHTDIARQEEMLRLCAEQEIPL